ncbi:MAG: hypothetical protein FD180_429 [Planctomycetota bacterium]|nr:MAG: hypothetical protein FD180_429 [Planctomycetota bacterium]
MSLNSREFWTVFHGMLVGAVFLLAFAGGLATLWGLRAKSLTGEEIDRRLRHLRWGTCIMAFMCWATVISGTWIVYPWYRAKSPDSPRSQLLADSEKAAWHTFGMEWKEHVSWLSPFLITAAAFLVSAYGRELARQDTLRRTVLALYGLAFFSAAIGGLLGAFINKVAPIA